MERKIKAVQYGCGKMSKFLMRYLMEHGAEIVAAFDVREEIIGKDIGDIMEGEKMGLPVSDAADADRMLGELKPDVCVIATQSTMPDIEDAMMLCAKHGVNAISTCEEAIYPWNSSPTITRALDETAKQNGCTLAGSGYPDMYWGVMVDTLAGSMHKITKIRGSSSYNVEDYGIALAKGHGAGLCKEDFDKQFSAFDDLPYEEIVKMNEGGEFAAPYMWNQAGWLCERMGLTLKSQTQRSVPQTAQDDLESGTLGMKIPKGGITGLAALVVAETEEGITFEIESVGKVYGKDDFDRNEWTFEGEPETTVIVNRPATVELTCATLVNRIPALLAADAGYVTTDKLPNSRYMTKPMQAYVER